MNAGMTVYNHERMNPRHKHDFDQVRYFLKGGENYGAHEVLRQGDAIYVPEGVSYGPTYTEEGCDGNIRFTLQFPGYRAIGSCTTPRRSTMRRSKNCPKSASWKRACLSGPMDASRTAPRPSENMFSGVRSSTRKRGTTLTSLCTRRSTTTEPMEKVPGVQVKHLGYFNEIGPNIKVVGIDAGANTPAGKAAFEQVRLLIDGDISYGGKDYQAVSCMYFPANVPYAATSSKQGATLFVVQLGSHDRERPPFCLI